MKLMSFHMKIESFKFQPLNGLQMASRFIYYQGFEYFFQKINDELHIFGPRYAG